MIGLAADVEDSQKDRLSARAILRETPILLLDEATSAFKNKMLLTTLMFVLLKKELSLIERRKKYDFG